MNDLVPSPVYWCALCKCQLSCTMECLAIAALTTPCCCNLDLHAIPSLHSFHDMTVPPNFYQQGSTLVYTSIILSFAQPGTYVMICIWRNVQFGIEYHCKYTVTQFVCHIISVTVSLQVPLGWWAELQMLSSSGK